MSFRAIALALVPVTLIAVSVTGFTVGAAAAGKPNVLHKSQATTYPPVDHQLCYNAAGTFSVPSGIRLINQFTPNGFVPTSISSVATVHCNPVVKTVPGGTYPITNPYAHLACFSITTSGQYTPQVVVANQFGSAELQPGQPNYLCVPSWKSLTGPPGKSPNTPPNLNHFTCYPVTPVSGAYTPPAPIKLQDEFASAPVTVTVNPVPSELCLPTEKVLPSGQVFPIINPTLHLLCYQVSPTPIITPVWDENQFGTSAVNIYSSKWLCLPSTKQIVS
jgi:hypothetical protein